MEDVKDASAAFNQLCILLSNEEFRQLVIQQRKILSENKTPHAMVELRNAIRDFLTRNKIPHCWIVPVQNYIVNDDLDAPFDPSMAIRVSDQELTQNHSEIVVIRENNKLPPDAEISIVISAKTSIYQIHKFIDQYADVIKVAQGALDLPDYDPPIWHETPLAIKIITMRDKEKKRFTDIARELEKSDSSGATYTASTIRGFYHTYKKRLGLEKR